MMPADIRSPTGGLSQVEVQQRALDGIVEQSHGLPSCPTASRSSFPDRTARRHDDSAGPMPNARFDTSIDFFSPSARGHVVVISMSGDSTTSIPRDPLRTGAKAYSVNSSNSLAIAVRAATDGRIADWACLPVARLGVALSSHGFVRRESAAGPLDWTNVPALRENVAVPGILHWDQMKSSAPGAASATTSRLRRVGQFLHRCPAPRSLIVGHLTPTGCRLCGLPRAPASRGGGGGG